LVENALRNNNELFEQIVTIKTDNLLLALNDVNTQTSMQYATLKKSMLNKQHQQ
jgi:hypothetical protein